MADVVDSAETIISTITLLIYADTALPADDDFDLFNKRGLPGTKDYVGMNEHQVETQYGHEQLPKTQMSTTADSKHNKNKKNLLVGFTPLARFFGKILPYTDEKRNLYWTKQRALEKDCRSLIDETNIIRGLLTNKEQQRQQKFLWCFRPINLPLPLSSNKHNRWIAFERKNQILLTQQLEKLHNGVVNDCCEIEDRNIFGRNLIATVLLKEGIAFVLNPDWSEPLTFEVALLPKLTWCQRLRSSKNSTVWLENQR
ncbi:hypothetical protein BDF20DRAFT_909957 [Mycotypha africana]|uniref:uncharacterized protein n=1 Tax=Mycotypha africana TaxID=64632 RepID=UPI0023013CE4|nr:uncharacterized protein BDF20DRAFT_909957 [Mycotypha africana]KAI8987321.1 hypothetical protein BDF20DRAFT_909957 [Mycotypha africana]